MTSQTQLPIIDEEAQREAAATAAVDEEEDQEEESATLAQVVRRRGTSKATHTRQRNAVTAAIQGRVDREEIIAERRVLVRDYDNVLNHHNRVIKLTPTGEDEKEKQWLAVVTQLHRDSLQEIDAYVALFPPPGYSRSHPPSSVHSSRSTRSVAFKLLDTQREVQEAELRLKQAEREADIRREEEAKKLEIDLAREQRRRTDELEELRLRNELLERQAAESLESVDLRQDPAAEQSRPSGVDPFHQPPFHVTNQQASSLVGTPVQPPASSSGARSASSKGIFSRVRGLFTPIRNSQSRVVANGSAVDGLGVSGARSGRLGVSGARSVSLGVFGAQTASTASVSGLANGLGVFGARAESQATTKSNPIAQNDLGVLGAQVAPPGATTAAASSHSVGQMVPLASSSQLLSGLPALVGVCSKVPTSVHHSRPAVSIAASWASDPVSSAPFVSMAPLREIAGVTTSISLPLTSIYAPAAPATSTAFIHPGGPPASSSVGHRYPSPSSAAYTSPVLPTSVGYTSAPYFVPPLDPTAAAFAAGVCGARPEGTAVGVSPSDSWPRGTYGVRPPELNSPDGWIDDLDLHRRSASYGSRSLARLPKRELMKFDGDPIKYPMFMRGFGVQVDRFCYDDSERQEFLRCSLSEEIQRHLGYLLMHPGGYHQCLLELRDRYGSPRVVAAACSKALFRLATFRDHDFKALSFFASSLRSVVATLQLSGFEDEMRSQATLQQVVSKLPPLLKDKWADYSVDIVDRLPSLVDLDNWLHRRVSADYYVRAGSDSSVPSTARDHQEPKGGGKGSFKPKVFAATDTQPKCSCCDRPHPTRKCRKFQELDPAKRTELVREKRLCLRCLDSDHLWAACKSDEKCGQDGCEKTHHRLMHGAPSLFPPRDGASGPRHRGKGRTGKAPSSTEGVKASADIPTSRLASFATVSTVQPKLVLLPIVPVIISANGHSVSTFALLDPGSEVTMLCESVKKRLNLTGPTEKAVIGTWHANDPAFRTTRVAFSVSPVDEGTSFAVAGGYTVPSLNLTKRPIARDKLVKKWPHLASVPLKQVDAAEVTLLVGTDHGDMHDVYEYRRDPLRVNAPKGILTAFGWTVTGDVWPAMGGDDRESPLSYRLSLSSGREGVKNVQCFHAAVGVEPLQMDNLILAVDQFLMQEAFAAVPEAKVPVGRDVARSRRILEETTRYRPDLGRYEAGILWAEDKPNLPDNRQGALERYRKTMRRLERNKEIADIVEREMNGYFDLGFAEKLTEEEVKGLVPGSFWVLPWHVVPHPYKPGKWRLVYDAKAAFGGVSLNSKLLKGEVLHVNMLGILIRMREFKVVVCGDITKMFHQVRVREADRNTFLFYRGVVGSPLPPELSRMVVFIFGSVSSPAVCAHVLKKSALDADPEDSQVAVREVDNQFYVDNWITSVPSEEEAVRTAEILTRVLKKGGFELAQWGSSSRRVLSQLPGNPVAALNLDIEGLPTERTLGISLDFHADCFVLKAMGNVDCKTRREILRATATNFDPLDFLAPVLLHAKLVLQSICQVTADWDATLGSSFLEKWRNWAGSLIAVNDLRIPRCFCPEEYNPDAVDLLMFSDSSERAFGAEGILRFELTNGTVKTAFVMAKSKVAPAAYVSMPRLELCGCLMSARMAAAIVKELRIKIRHVVLFTDSTTNLRWINSRECKFTPYVSSRVGEILELYDPPHWRYVPTLLNPADDLSRGLEAEELKVSHRFYTGPAFVQQPMEEWPTLPDLKLPSDAPPDPEVRAVKFVGVAKDSVPYIDTLLASVKPFSRIKRTVAYVVRWINVVRARVRERKSRDTVETSFPVATSVASQAGGSSTLVAAAATSSSAPAPVRVTTVKKNVAAGKGFIVAAPTPDEIAAAVLLLIKRAQAREYARELCVINRGGCLDMSFPIARCLPYIDEQGLLRVGGRLQNAPVPFDVRHPIILPPKAKVTERIVREIHLKTGHSRPWRTLPEVQRLYWITAPRRVIRRAVDRCTLCRRFAATACTPLMAALPASRLQLFQAAFTHTCVDYFGPIEVKMFRRTVKRWGCLFRCMTTGACHLEMAYALDADAFLCAYGNFKATRGTPKIVRSDNGTNFVGAKRELAEALERLDSAKIYDHMALEGTKWIFSPPSAPHFGGIWESMVKAAKRALESVLYLQEFTDQSLSCALKQVEYLLNSRPLTYVSIDPTAPEPLTPFHLLLGQANPNIPPDVFHSSDLSHKKRWRVAQAVAEHFWRRWMAEYMPSLTERRKWITKERQLRVGDVVIIVDEKTSRGYWPLGLVTAVYPGPDGLIRSVMVRHRGTELQRPVVKLALLMSDEEAEEREKDAAAKDRRAGDVPSADGDDEA